MLGGIASCEGLVAGLHEMVQGGQSSNVLNKIASRLRVTWAARALLQEAHVAVDELWAECLTLNSGLNSAWHETDGNTAGDNSKLRLRLQWGGAADGQGPHNTDVPDMSDRQRQSNSGRKRVHCIPTVSRAGQRAIPLGHWQSNVKTRRRSGVASHADLADEMSTPHKRSKHSRQVVRAFERY